MIHLPKSQPPPESLAIEKLKKNGKYDCDDVLERLRKDFKEKCYICEEGNINSTNIEHFKPKKTYPHLKFDWDNLFHSCVHCNMIKEADFDNILNCTIQTDQVDTKIKYLINPLPKENEPEIIILALEDIQTVHNTVQLLNKVYNGHNTTTKQGYDAGNLRKKLLKEVRKFQNFLLKYNENNFDLQEKDKLKNKIIKEIQNSAAFCAFKRWIIRENNNLISEFQQYFN